VLKFLLVVILMRVLVYLHVRVIQRRGSRRPDAPRRRPGRAAVAPDDDPTSCATSTGSASTRAPRPETDS
jgi:hypothetical protein